MNSRRHFLRATAVAASAAATLPALSRAAGARSAAPAPKRGLIDLHTHWFSPGSVEFLSKRSAGPKFIVNARGEKFIERTGALAAAPGGGQNFPLGDQWFDIAARLRHLDEQGVAHQLLSWPTTLGVDPTLTATEARTLWKIYNDELSGVVHRHASRLSGLATLATIDPEWSARELARAHDQLGLIGGVLPVNVFATLEGAKRFAPVFAAAQKYRSHLYLHTGYGHASVPGQPPLNRHADSAGQRGSLDNIWNFAAATITFAYSGFLDAYPDVTVQIAQLGGSGGIALVVELARSATARGPGNPGRFDQLYFDTGAGGRGPEAIALATRVFGPERVVFGTDYAPGPSVAPIIANVDQSPLSAAQREKIFTANARDLLARKGVKFA